MHYYKFKNSERNVPKGSEYETRALLYLISSSPIKNEVENIFIDCFNDVTGTEKNLSELYDIQAKGVASLNPKKIGEALITLFQNYLTSFDFTHLILFVQRIDSKYLLNINQEVFGLENFGKHLIKIRQGLIEEYSHRNSELMGRSILNPLINIFLSRVVIVIDNKSKSGYIRAVSKFNSKEIGNDILLENIFSELQANQLAKKRIYIENVEINNIKDALIYKKYINVKEIHTLILNRLIGNNLLTTTAIPIYFLERIKKLDSEDSKDLILECQIKICLAYFDKNSTQEFWHFFEKSFSHITSFPFLTSSEIYEKVIKDTTTECRYLIDEPGIFLISLIKQGILNENN